MRGGFCDGTSKIVWNGTVIGAQAGGFEAVREVEDERRKRKREEEREEERE